MLDTTVTPTRDGKNRFFEYCLEGIWYLLFQNDTVFVRVRDEVAQLEPEEAQKIIDRVYDELKGDFIFNPRVYAQEDATK